MSRKRIAVPEERLLAGALPALLRARRRAEEIARATNTALIFWKDGRLVRVEPSREQAPHSG